MDPDAGSSSSASPAGGPHSKSNSYTRSSCDLCKRLKIKCEKKSNSCLHCLDRGATCVTTLAKRKKRQPTRPTSLIDIENRLKLIESVVTASGLTHTQRTSAPVSDSSLATPINLTDRLSTLVINEEGKTRFLGGSSGLSLFSPQGLEWITEKTGSDEVSRFVYKLATDVHTNCDKSAAELYRPPFASEREPLPPKHIADRYVDYFFESYNKLFPLYDKASFDQSYELQYSGHPPNGSAWYASLNIVLCLGCLLSQVRTISSLSENTDKNQVWKNYLRNASGCLLELLFEEGSLESIQALIGMAVMHQVHLQPQAVYILVAAAGRLAYGIGLHRNPNDDWDISDAEIVQRKNVFWILYTMDKTIALRLGQPSVMNDDDIGIDLPPQEVPPTEIDMFRYRVQLARLESRIYSELYSARGQSRLPLERLRLVGELDKALIEWKEQLPAGIKPESPIECHEDLVLPIVLMHFTYLNCLTVIHRVSIHHGSWSSTRRDHGLHEDAHLNPRVYASQAICLAAARQSIQLLKSIDFETRAVWKSGLWMILYYPLSNFLTLFANTLQSPQDPQAFSDLKLMEMVISLLSDPAFHVNVPTTNTAQLFVELSSVARKLANKANPDIARLKKCSRGEDEDKPHDDVSAHDSETVSGLENPGLQSCSTKHVDENLPISSLDARISDDFYPFDPIDSNLFASSNTPILADNLITPSDLSSFAPLMSEYFEWDLANLWSFGQGPSIFTGFG